MLDLVIPDSGPLITLGVIGRLDLIDRFNCGIVIADMVGHEIRRGPEAAADKAAFDEWFEQRGNRVQIVDTTYGMMWSRLSDEDRKAVKRLHPDAGELAIREFTEKVRQTLHPENQVLVLFEDDAVKRMDFGDHVHLLHTYAFLQTLENMKVIASANAIFGQIHKAGRNLARDLFERRAQTPSGEVADWQADYDVIQDPARTGSAI
jgi:hypothetical protein